VISAESRLQDPQRAAFQMKWIRGPLWDGFWVLSGLPIGLGLLCLTGPWYDWPNPQHYQNSTTLLVFFSLVPLLETGHSLSPIAAAWWHVGFRRVMLERKSKFILLPVSVFVGSAAVGAATSLDLTSYQAGPHQMFEATGLTNPFPIVVWLYMVWNAYHFGMQNFGVLSIYRKRREIAQGSRLSWRADVEPALSIEPNAKSQVKAWGQRRVDKTFCLLVTCVAMATAFPISFLHTMDLRDPCIALSLTATGGMLWRDIRAGFSLPRLIFIMTDGLALALIWWQPLIGVTVYSLNHWLVAIGLSSHVCCARWHWAFALAMLLIGAVGFLWLIPTPNGTLLRVIPITVSARLGLGFAHFLYDRWLWKMDDQHVRATIARNLFEPVWSHRKPG
jgi:hypothetical protein